MSVTSLLEKVTSKDRRTCMTPIKLCRNHSLTWNLPWSVYHFFSDHKNGRCSDT